MMRLGDFKAKKTLILLNINKKKKKELIVAVAIFERAQAI
jgi:hypothetical protein